MRGNEIRKDGYYTVIDRNKIKNEQSVVEESKGGQLSAGDNSQAEHVTEEVVEKKDQQLNEKEEGGGNEPQQ